MNKFLVETEDGQIMEVLTNNIYPPVVGHFDRITSKVIPNKPVIYNAYGKHMYNKVDLSHEIIVGYGYFDVHHAEKNTAYTITNKKIGKLSDLPNYIGRKITDCKIVDYDRI